MSEHPDYPKTRLYVTDRLQRSAVIECNKEQAHYIHSVLRLLTGARVALFNGTDGEWLSEITISDRKYVSITVSELLRPQSASPDIWLLFAPLKRGKHEDVIDKATQLGVSAFQPVVTKHTEVDRVHEDRLQKIAIEAAEQCERIDIPIFHPINSLEKTLSAWPQDRVLLYGDESGGGAAINSTQGAKFALLIGPEGGFSQSELATLKTLPFAKPITLGPRILKADTAAIAALACLMSHKGDWNLKPAFRAAS